MPAIIWVKKKEKKALPPPDVPKSDPKKPQGQVQVTVVKIIDNVFGRKKKTEAPQEPKKPKKKSQRTAEQKQEVGTKALAKLKNVISSKKEEQSAIGDQLKDIKVSEVEAASYKEGKDEKELEQLENQGQAIISVLKDIPKKKEEKKLYEDIDEEERRKRLEDIYLLEDGDEDAAEASRPKWMFKTIPTGSMATLEELFGFVDLSESSVLRWKLDGMHPIRIEDEDDHDFNSEDCYIILHVPEQEAKSKMLTLHYWIGKNSTMDKQCLSAMRSVQLNSLIRGRAKHYREEEGEESIIFLELFKGEIEYVSEDPSKRPLRPPKKTPIPTSLYRLFTFEKKEYMQKVPFSSEAFTKDTVLLLLNGKTIYQWNGSQSPPTQQYRAIMIAEALKKEISELNHILIGEGDNIEEIPEFCEPFIEAQKERKEQEASEESEEGKKESEDPSEKKPIIPKELPEKQEQSDPFASSLIYRFERDPETGKLGMKTAWEGKSGEPLSKSLLNQDYVYLLDFSSEIFIWRGKNAPIRDQQTALILATKLKTTRDKSVTVTNFLQNTEGLLLKLKFNDWVSLTSGPKPKLATKSSLDQSVFLQHLMNPRPSLPSSDPPQGTFEVYMFSTGKWGKLRPDQKGEFYSGNPHFVLYSYPKGLHEKQRYLSYFWQGKDSDFKSWASFSLGFYPILNGAIGKKGGMMTKTQINQQAEPTPFMKLFKDQIIIHRGKKEDPREGQTYSLYRVRTEPDETSYIVEIDHAKKNVGLQSNDTLIIRTDSKIGVLKYKHDKSSHALEYALSVLKEEREVQEFTEGKEQDFWGIGGVSDANIVHLPSTRLFSFSYVAGSLNVFEHLKITQETFASSNCNLLIAPEKVYVWVGSSVIPSLQDHATLYAKKYAETNSIQVQEEREGSESVELTQFFNDWGTKKKIEDPQSKRDENFRKLEEHENYIRLKAKLSEMKAQIERIRKIEEERERIRKELEAAAEEERKEAEERELRKLEEQRRKWDEEERERKRKEEEERLQKEEDERRKREEEAEPDEDYFSILEEGDERLAEGEVEVDESGATSTSSSRAKTSSQGGGGGGDEGSCKGCGRALGDKCIEVLNALWHPYCFLCASCNKSLTDGFVLNEKDQKPYCPSCFAQQAAKYCPGCNELIGYHDKTLTACDKKWHVDCFVCTKCKKDLSDGFIEEGGMPYCDSCEEELFSGTCSKCQKPLGSSSIEALGQQFHRDCFCCFKCSGSIDDGFIDHEDELYCENCYESIFSRPCTRCSKPLKSAFVNIPDGDKLYPFHPDCISCEVCKTSLLEVDFEQKSFHLFCLKHADSEVPASSAPSTASKPPKEEPKPKDQPKSTPPPASDADNCWRCKKPLKNEEVKAMGHLWHPECFVCTKCKGSLDDGFIRRDDMPYCEDCIEKLNSENKKGGSTDNCAACGKPLSGKTVEVEDDEIYHKECFKCVGCGNNFEEDDFYSKDGKLYCEECHP